MSNESEGTPMSASELAEHFGQEVPKEKPPEKHGIYEINARVKNLARGSGGSLTPVGDMLCNTYTHVLKDFYNFAETLPEPHKTIMLALISRHEDMPLNVIAAAVVGVNRKK